MDKKITIEKFNKIVDRKKNKVVLCHGVFDYFHYGHLEHFTFAKKHGDILIVSVTSDKFVKKGTDRPYYSINERLKILNSLNIIDYLIVSDAENGIKMIESIKPNFYCKGIEYKAKNNDLTGNISKEINVLKKYNGKIIYSDKKTLSSSNIINNITNIKNIHQKRFISNFSNKNLDLMNLIKRLSKINVLTLGEFIIDEYIFCEVLGKASKDNMLTYKKNVSSFNIGGVGAIAKNISNFVKNINLISFVGDKDTNNYDKYFKKNTKSIFLKKKSSPTIKKTRYLDKNSSKLIGIYDLEDRILNNMEEKQILTKVKKILNLNDLLIISDYGHGIFTPKISKFISNSKIFKSATIQLNSSNIFTQDIHKFKNLDLLVINENELRLFVKDKNSELSALTKNLCNELNIKTLVVTRGESGCFFYNKIKKINIVCPAFSVKTVDKVGAGDTLLSFLSIFLYLKVDFHFSLFFASYLASKNINNYANSYEFKVNDLFKEIAHYIK